MLKKSIFGALLISLTTLVQAQYHAKLIEVSPAWGSLVADFNRDGHDDFFITGHHANDRIWYWTPSGYAASAQQLTRSDRHDCDVADVNHDGRLDFYCAVGAEKGAGVKVNELWIQNLDGSHTKAVNFGAEDPYGRSRRPVFFDMNHDGYPDLYLTNYAQPRTDGQLNINQVFINQAGTGFVALDTAATGEKGSLCVAKGDVNQDGWDDLVVCDKVGLSHLYINNRAGNFEDLAPRIFTRNVWTDAKLVDMNKDGRDDLVVITAQNMLQIWLNTGKGKFFDAVSFQEKLPFTGVSLAIGDFNGDGAKDVYVVLLDDQCKTTGRDQAPDVAYISQPNGGWLKRQLIQAYQGCGYLADVVDGDKVLLMNGGPDWAGPNYLITLK